MKKILYAVVGLVIAMILVFGTVYVSNNTEQHEDIDNIVQEVPVNQTVPPQEEEQEMFKNLKLK